MKTHKTLALTVAGLAVLAIGCGNDEEPSRDQAPPAGQATRADAAKPSAKPFEHPFPYELSAGETAFLDRAKQRLADGKDVNSTGARGMTMLHEAAARNYCAVADYLIQHGADLAIRDEAGRTPLHLAAAGGHTHVAERLLDAGADPSLEDYQEKTPLSLAVDARADAMAELLRRHGASAIGMPDPVDQQEQAFMAEIVEAMKQHKDLNAPLDDAGQRRIHLAAEKGYSAAVVTLIDSGADVEARDNSGQTPLHKAAAAGHLETVQVLRSKGANSAAQDNDGRTPHQLAVENGHTGVAAKLGARDQMVDRILRSKGPLAHTGNADGAADDPAKADQDTDDASLAAARKAVADGANVNARDVAGWTLLHQAASSGHVKTVQYLLANGANVAIGDVTRRTPLHLAAEAGHAQVVRLLLEKGADRNARDVTGATPAALAAAAGHQDVAQLLR